MKQSPGCYSLPWMLADRADEVSVYMSLAWSPQWLARASDDSQSGSLLHQPCQVHHMHKLNPCSPGKSVL